MTSTRTPSVSATAHVAVRTPQQLPRPPWFRPGGGMAARPG
eukprot:CAMPEP_0177395158 /NCGR_PEP_ID=MMETSP0368-20130122/55976_1 /TAXON_ID=447022 ORGANISM="Scrippsiella hangoei-like, Strain SHHI-4" /NCGR_SAMPLE_ID=MMETSP0368 /ASSEMBLY_ACC=CAM_ASM_000363 /LENGTH=40 /DNA_ID= /DNA_START= /DNA_END= /DNA_ORIENTATION=